MTIRDRQASRRSALAEHLCPTYQVEKAFPRSEYPHLTDEARTCSSREELADAIDDFTGIGVAESYEAADEILAGEEFEHEDHDGEFEVTVSRV